MATNYSFSSDNTIASEYDAIFAACSTEAEIDAIVSGIDFVPMNGALVAYITASYDNAVARIRRAQAAAFAPTADDRAAESAEFDRLFLARRGTLRIERGDYVIIAHCHTVEQIEFVIVQPARWRWYVSLNYRDVLVTRTELTARASYDDLNNWIIDAIFAHRAS